LYRLVFTTKSTKRAKREKREKTLNAER